MKELITINTYPVINVLSKLLQDKTTGNNIIYGTDYYLGYGCSEKAEMTAEAVRNFGAIDIQPRVKKAQAEQSERTRSKAEVFTPTWIVQKMNDYCDGVWLESKYADDWQKYVQLRILEITCGEAPFLANRYDTTTGEPIEIDKRTGILDRKLRAIQADNEEMWLKWAYIAFESTYGYEFQGDNLFIARINLLMTFCDYLESRWHRKATDSELKHITNIIVWNIWQMDGLKDTVPLGERGEAFHQFSLFDEEEPVDLDADSCKIYNHRSGNSLLFSDIKEGISNMRFDFVIGNPPYQEEAPGTSTSDKPIYHYFMDAAYTIADKVELITPGRFLFNAGATPTIWNARMLSDTHLKVLHFEQVSSRIFANTDIKGGVAITYRDTSRDFGAIEIFSPFAELNSIRAKAAPSSDSDSLFSIIYNQNKFNLDALYAKHPEYQSVIGSDGKDKRFRNNIFDKIELFTEKKTHEDDLSIFGLVKNKRVWRYFPQEFTDLTHENLFKHKVFVPRANGSGAIGEVLSTPLCGTPLCGYTQSFIGIGAFDTAEEANNCMKYVKSKFARTMLGILKITQDNPPEKWRLVPLQDFSSQSDIDWSKSIPEIDRQLYAKYGLSQEEIDFIETHVKPME